MTSNNENPRRERSRNKVLIALQNEPKRFTDLEKDTKLSPSGLNQILKILKNENIIESTLIDDKPRYQLTKKGVISLDDAINLSNDVNRIRSRGGKHFRDYSNLWYSMISLALHWGIESDLTLDKNLSKLHILEKKDVKDIEKILYEKLLKNIKNGKLNEKQIGDIVLGFKINYADLIQSINDNSLTYMENITKEEIRLLQKMANDGKNVTHEEFKKWKGLRQKTLHKIKRRNEK